MIGLAPGWMGVGFWICYTAGTILCTAIAAVMLIGPNQQAGGITMPNAKGKPPKKPPQPRPGPKQPPPPRREVRPS